MNAPPSTLPPGSIVDSYRRDSGGPRQEQSTDQQLDFIEEFCQKHGLIHRHRFVDKAKSGGTVVGRDDFDKMLNLYYDRAQRPNGLILWNFARFARDLDDAQFNKILMRKKWGMVVYSITDQVPEGQHGRIVEFVIDLANEEKRKQTSADAKRGLRNLVEKYKCVPGVPPRGFKRVKVVLEKHSDNTEHIAHRWDPDPKFRVRIRKAFTMLATGSSLQEISKATRIYASDSSYKTFFVNKIYIGILEYGGEVYDDYCKPTVDIATWNKCQKIIRDRAQLKITDRHPRRTNSAYLLSGIIKCNKCGSPLNGNTVNRKTGSLERDEGYRCSRAKRRHDCDAHRIPRKSLEKIVINTIVETMLEPEALAAHQQLALENQDLGELVKEERLASLTHERGELTRQILNLTNAIAEGGHTSVLLDALKQKESQRTQVKKEVTELDIPIQRIPHLSKAQIESASKELIQLLTTSPPETRRQILRGLVHEITAEKNGTLITGTLTYYYPPPFDYAPMLPTEPVPMGALLYRQRFTQPFEAEIKPHSH
jgi:DNA invertase Pin-like site-specific DNA recombinase